MAKKFVNQYCIHCLKYFENLTRDHIFPESWYPDSTPQNQEKWVAPACLNCNNKLGRIEEDVYKKIAPTMSYKDVASAGISEKAMRLYNPFYAKNESDRRRKLANLKNIRSSFILVDSDNLPKNIMKNFGHVAEPSKKVPLLFIENDLLNPFFEKIIRGLEFQLRGRLIGNDRKIELLNLPESINSIPGALDDANKALRDGFLTDRGPGFIVQSVKDHYGSVLYHVVIWGKLEIWGSVSNK